MILSAQEISKRFKMALRLDISPRTIHVFAKKLGYRMRQAGGKRGYHQSLYTFLSSHIKEMLEYENSISSTAEKNDKKANYPTDYYSFNGERDNIDYEWEKNENKIRNAIIESINELDLYHGSRADFNEFDLAYLSTGWGEQAYGHGFYLISTLEGASQYSRGGFVYKVKVPSKPYLSYNRISSKSANRIAKALYDYYINYDEYGKEAYKGHEKEFWEYECSTICHCSDGGSVYGTVASILGSDKKTSEFLHDLGYKGIKWLDKVSKCTNYVIFNPKDIKILSKVKV